MVIGKTEVEMCQRIIPLPGPHLVRSCRAHEAYFGLDSFLARLSYLIYFMIQGLYEDAVI